MTDLLIIIIGTLVLLGLGTSWVWNSLVRQLKELKKVEDELDEVLSHRQDTIPYLIESYRGVVPQGNPYLNDLIVQRDQIRSTRDFSERLKQEEILTAQLNELFEKTAQNQILQRDIGWLEARTEIQKIVEEVGARKNRYHDLHIYIQDKLGQFPYLLFKKQLEQKL
jgi:hypothetical protein